MGSADIIAEAAQTTRRTCVNQVYTLGVWHVTDGKQDEFVDAWQRLGRLFLDLPHPPREGTLLQSLDDPLLFYSFGPWESLEDIQEMRKDPEAAAAIQELLDLCEDGKPGAFRVVATA